MRTVMSSARMPAASMARTASATSPGRGITGSSRPCPAASRRAGPAARQASAVATGDSGAVAATVTRSQDAPAVALSSAGVPSAVTRPPSMTQTRSASRSASSRYCVVSSSVVPPATRSGDDLPEGEPARRVEAGGGLVEEQHSRLGQQARRQVKAAAHPAGVAAHRPAGRRVQAEGDEQVGRPVPRLPPAKPGQPAEHDEVGAAGQALVHRGVLAGQADAAAHRRAVGDHVVAGHQGRAGSPAAAAW